jgi:CubicO group peptidase (beta-lactamase class C family)/tetratricopeptide (TPR) repeat protein
MEREGICGLSVALVEGEKTIWAEGFGHTDLGKKERVTAETLFSSQSFGKCLTATAFLILASKGLIGLDDPIRKYYPKFTINTKFGYPEEEIARITFRRMLSHWAGLTHEALVGSNYDDRQCTFDEHIESISEGWLKSPVGSELSYSNLGYELTGYVMGLVMGNPYDEVMKEVLLNPLDMKSATYKIEEALDRSFAKGHSGKYSMPVVQVPMLPSGGLYISANDVAKFISFHLKKGRINNRQVIDPNLFKEMYRTQYPEVNEFGYGLGIYSYQRIRAAKAYGHAGGGYGYQNLMQWVPEHDVGVIVLTNDSRHSILNSLTKKVLEMIIDEKMKPRAKIVKSESLERLEGTYIADDNLSPQLIRISMEEGKLYHYTAGSETEVLPQSPTEFLSENGTKYNFELDEEGRPSLVYVDDSVFPFRAKYNDGPRDEPGPNYPEFQEYEGVHRYQQYGRVNYLALSVMNGHLYLTFEDDDLKLHQYRNEIYFTADGEALIMKKDALNYKGISTEKIDLDVEQVIETIKLNKDCLNAYYVTVRHLSNVLYKTRGFNQALSLIDRTVEIDDSFKVIYERMGRRMYAYGELDKAKKCYTRLLEIDSTDNIAEDILGKIEQKMAHTL